MIFNKLRIKNFKQFEELELVLDSDLNILSGDNESGKSTILEALALVTTGRFSNRNFESFLSNDIFNKKIVNNYLQSLETAKPLPPPEIEIELYAKDNPEHAKHKGRNNSKSEDVPGLKYIAQFNSLKYGDTYKDLVNTKKIKDMPLEFYHYEWRSFAESPITSYNNPVSASVIDTAQVNNTVIGSYIGKEIKESLSDDEIRKLGASYRKIRNQFSEEDVLKKMNSEIADRPHFKDKKIDVALTSVTTSEWQKELSLRVNQIPFSFSGKGAQNTIKTNLALAKIPNKTKILLIEEPENNLSFTNMSKLIDSIIEYNKDKQIFIATHSSFVANKLGLDKLVLLYNSSPNYLSDLPKDTMKYFKKLPGYETLRTVIAEKVILVEGPTDELVVQAAYMKQNKKLPISDGIDVISVRSLAFKRFCDIAILLNKPINIVTDNDGNISKNITEKYSQYKKEIDKGMISIFYDRDEKLNTLEPSFLKVNESKQTELGTLFGKEKEKLLYYMNNNKTEWALKILDNAKDFEYPEYINECITEIKK